MYHGVAEEPSVEPTDAIVSENLPEAVPAVAIVGMQHLWVVGLHNSTSTCTCMRLSTVVNGYVVMCASTVESRKLLSGLSLMRLSHEKIMARFLGRCTIQPLKSCLTGVLLSTSSGDL